MSSPELPSVDRTSKDLPAELPVLPVRTGVLFPGMAMPIAVEAGPTTGMLEKIALGDRLLAVVAVREGAPEPPQPSDLFEVGTAAQIAQLVRLPQGGLNLVVRGLARVRIGTMVQTDPFWKASVEVRQDREAVDKAVAAEIPVLQRLFRRIVELAPYLDQEMSVLAVNLNDAGRLSDLVAASLPLSVQERQTLLEIRDTRLRLERTITLTQVELEKLELSQRIQEQVEAGMQKQQREHLLRQQLQAIQRELGEDTEEQEVQALRDRVRDAHLPEDVRKVAEREVDRLARTSSLSPDSGVIRTYVEWVPGSPVEAVQPPMDLVRAKEILDRDHYDLEKVKRRILEYLAVRKLKPDAPGPILCFVGPPGVGKTSLGQAIAEAMGRPFIRVSLGGIRDEADIRGHRRTYVGAMPGRIIQALKRAGTNHPVFMLDELDKLGTDFRGDPAAALLEVLDPEQNRAFVDHYLDLPFDLSRVMFIGTANLLDPLPPALLDRLETVQLPGYTEAEKLNIASRHLVPRQLTRHGLSPEALAIPDPVLQEIIASYTREAGVRQLEREIAALCRYVARDVAEGRTRPRTLQVADLRAILGPARFYPEVAERVSRPGIATGLAWTEYGGELLFIEAAAMPGGGNLTLTGRLGDVMKESAQAALSLIRARAASLGIRADFYEHVDLHIHVPEGAIPKDGPSAGVAMYTALVSLLTERPVRTDVAMTGEITLRGLVLPIGGVKEKVLAARRAGIERVLLPARNAAEVEDLPSEIRERIEFVYLTSVDEIPPLTLAPAREPAEVIG